MSVFYVYLEEHRIHYTETNLHVSHVAVHYSEYVECNVYIMPHDAEA